MENPIYEVVPTVDMTNIELSDAPIQHRNNIYVCRMIKVVVILRLICIPLFKVIILREYFEDMDNIQVCDYNTMILVNICEWVFTMLLLCFPFLHSNTRQNYLCIQNVRCSNIQVTCACICAYIGKIYFVIVSMDQYFVCLQGGKSYIYNSINEEPENKTYSREIIRTNTLIHILRGIINYDIIELAFLTGIYGYLMYINFNSNRSNNRRNRRGNHPKSTLTFIEDEIECTICLMPMNHVVMKLPCDHIFHVDCIVPWGQKKTTCPLCREQFTIGDDFENV